MASDAKSGTSVKDGSPPEPRVADYRRNAARSWEIYRNEKGIANLRITAADHLELYRYLLFRLAHALLVFDEPSTFDQMPLEALVDRLVARLPLLDERWSKCLRGLRELRKELYHRELSAPNPKYVEHLSSDADAFLAFVESEVSGVEAILRARQSTFEQCRELYKEVDRYANLAQDEFPDEKVKPFVQNLKWFPLLVTESSPPEALEALKGLLQNEVNRISALYVSRYEVCPKCGGPITERNYTTSYGGTADDPEPTHSYQHWELGCANCGHKIESDSVEI
ncbi:MAG: hypothetical protein L3J95_05070 [Thermoplasmata archaeon]|nr:hypothetical protein [Thermoplasmata archaeon]MCI4359772.1 hypothetical protein [Thermoplasmata archaeon]